MHSHLTNLFHAYSLAARRIDLEIDTPLHGIDYSTIGIWKPGIIHDDFYNQAGQQAVQNRKQKKSGIKPDCEEGK
ncbi:MAG: hypothetical protein CTY19_15200 [Methylomonas sp.]|nr:MAG: hypothetical protein CTY19_15200 [Methylomonas sp.]